MDPHPWIDSETALQSRLAQLRRWSPKELTLKGFVDCHHAQASDFRIKTENLQSPYKLLPPRDLTAFAVSLENFWRFLDLL